MYPEYAQTAQLILFFVLLIVCPPCIIKYRRMRQKSKEEVDEAMRQHYATLICRH